jgi:hypothetical protein
MRVRRSPPVGSRSLAVGLMRARPLGRAHPYAGSSRKTMRRTPLRPSSPHGVIDADAGLREETWWAVVSPLAQSTRLLASTVVLAGL